MASAEFSNVAISGIVTVVPKIVKSIDDEIDLYGGNAKQVSRIKSVIGLDKRHVTDDSMTTLDLCVAASDSLVKGLHIDRNEIDGVIFVTQTPDHFQPSNAAILHGKLGLDKNALAFDVNLGCSGYVYGLWLAHMMVSSGTCSRVLLLAGDTLSKCINKRDRSTAPLFGDAGSATLIEKSELTTKSTFVLHTDGSGSDFIKIPAGGFRQPSDEASSLEKEDADGNWLCDNDLHMNGGEVFNFSIQTEPKAIKEILDFTTTSSDDIDYFIFHQANKYIISNIARRLKLDLEKVPSTTVAKYGNQSSASIPCTINDSLGEEVSNNRRKLLLSGFGVGLSWASAIIDIDSIFCPPVQEI